MGGASVRGGDSLNGNGENETLNGGIGDGRPERRPGTDIVNGDAGSLTGPPLDLSVDTLNGGAGSDHCQPPDVPDLIIVDDVLIACNPEDLPSTRHAGWTEPHDLDSQVSGPPQEGSRGGSGP